MPPVCGRRCRHSNKIITAVIARTPRVTCTCPCKYVVIVGDPDEQTGVRRAQGCGQCREVRLCRLCVYRLRRNRLERAGQRVSGWIYRRRSRRPNLFVKDVKLVFVNYRLPLARVRVRAQGQHRHRGDVSKLVDARLPGKRGQVQRVLAARFELRLDKLRHVQQVFGRL